MFVIKDLQDKVRKPFNFQSNDLSSCIPMYVLSSGFEGYPEHGN
jgi:hypothetical protein